MLDLTNQAVLDIMIKHHMLSDVVTITDIQDIVILRGWLQSPNLPQCFKVGLQMLRGPGLFTEVHGQIIVA